ncbi:MAG TPA: molybdenum cofactor guanylyltransferase [Solirubrobacteraceae bacterium]|jgi:molybdopterin-guanine dinucleotide biosynthesis protein A|nr:molybdenum cofactor guanylyltransferase [Solirubrobacteraceae bacterium]
MYFDLRRNLPAWETGAMTVTVAVLAGGRGSRLGGDKALVELAGVPLIEYPLKAAREAGLDAVVVAKLTTRLPHLDVPVLIEPDEPTHPLLGILTALQQYRAVLAIPCDMPFVSAVALAALTASPADLATLAPNQPFPSLYRRAILPQLREALAANLSMKAAQAHSICAPASVPSTDPVDQLSINTPEDLAAAERRLASPR